MENKKIKVIVGLSGGVDSSVALLKLKEQGYDVEAMYMRNWDSAINNDVLGNPDLMDEVCPQERDYQDAKKVAHQLGIQLHRVDFIEEYWDSVFSFFLSEYKKNRTPNPDILCNKEIKFKTFLDKAIALGADYIAMGHYARVIHDGDKHYLLRGIDENKDQIAAVIVEPVAANMGLVLPEEGFLEFLREITKDHGSLLIFDEVITGFRLSLGGAQQYYNIKPDITTLGKIVGGGMPIGAYGGRREIMQMISPDGPVYQAGTLSGNPVATTAGIETLNILKNDPQIYERLEQKTRKLADAAREAGKGHICVNQIGSLMSVFFTDQKVRDFESAVTSNTEQYADYFGYLLDRGIYIAPSQFETMFISNAHTEEDIEKTCKLAGEALCSLDF